MAGSPRISTRPGCCPPSARGSRRTIGGCAVIARTLRSRSNNTGHFRSAISNPRTEAHFFANITTCPRSSAGRSFRCDLLPDCGGAMRGHIRPGRPRGLCLLVPDDRGVALCWRPSSAHELTGKHRQVSIRSDGYRCDALIPIRARSRPVPAPPHVRPGPYCSRASGRPRGRPPLGFL
jgi:hypothetical protein